MKKKLISYGVQVLIGVALSLAVGFGRLSQMPQNTAGKLMSFSDGFTVIGLVWICFGVIMLASNTGLFDALGYTFRRGFNAIFPNWNPYEGSYYDYILEKKEKRKKTVGKEIFLAGATILAIGVVLVLLWYRVAE